MPKEIKVLFAAPYIYKSNWSEFSKNKTGFGIIVEKIFSLVKQVENACLISHVLTKGHDAIVSHNILSILYHARIKDYYLAFKQLLFPDTQDVNRFKLAYYYLDKGFFSNLVKKYEPDVVHIHGIGIGTNCYIDVCRENSTPYIVTIHGVLEKSSTASNSFKNIERRCLRELNEEKIPITVVSTGIKRRLLDCSYYGLCNDGYIKVITNGTDVKAKEAFKNIREQYNIPLTGKIIVAIGSVYAGKNQIEIVRAYARMSEVTKENTWIFIIGNIIDGYPIQEEVNRLDLLKKHIFLTGFLPFEDIINYYNEADLLILASIEEGFGLSLIEGFVYGVPSVTFSDLDAVPDVYDERAMMLCHERTDKALAATIELALEKNWDKEWIKGYSKKFSLESMRDKYLDVYREVIAENKKLKSKGS